MMNRQNRLKWLLLFFGASAFVIVLLNVMQNLVEPDNIKLKDYEESQPLQYVRIVREEVAREQTRELPKKEQLEEQTPSKPDLHITAETATPNISRIDIPKMAMPLSFSQDFTLGNFIGGGADGNVLPLVQIKPRYPRQAKSRGIEGWVKLKINISKDGKIYKAYVIGAKPRGVFEREALRAVKRWKFKPSIVNGVAVENSSVQVINFKLEDA